MAARSGEPELRNLNLQMLLRPRHHETPITGSGPTSGFRLCALMAADRIGPYRRPASPQKAPTIMTTLVRPLPQLSPAPAAAEAATPPARLRSVDALRGFDMFWIIGATALVQ